MQKISLAVGCFVTLLIKTEACAEQISQNNEINAINLAKLSAHLVGRWHGEGEFSSGKKISAQVSFESSLDGKWLLYRHDDQAPNRYHALGMWGYQKNATPLIMVVFDSFSGYRQFDAVQNNDSIVFERNTNNLNEQKVSERFTFVLSDQNHFTMRFENQTADSAWRLVDTVNFERIHE